MSNWIMIDPKQLQKELSGKPTKGVKINLFLSPYDIPNAVSGEYDPKEKRFLIKFKYLSDEPLESRELDKNVVLKIGKNSNRLYEIVVDVDALKANVVALEVKQAIDKFEVGAESHTKESYRVAKEILRQRKSEIFAPLEMAT